MVPVVLLVIAVFLYSPYISAAPLAASGSDFENLRQNTALQRFQKTLLNETLLPFLKICNEPGCCIKADQFICPVYYELLLNVNNANVSDDVLKTQAESLKDGKKEDEKTLEEFCSTFSPLIEAANLKWTLPHFKTFLSTGCSATCADINEDKTVTIKPVCKFVVWMFNVTAQAVPKDDKLVAKIEVNKTDEPPKPLANQVVAPGKNDDLVGANMAKKITMKPTTVTAKPTKSNADYVQQQESQVNDGDAPLIAKKPPLPALVTTKEVVVPDNDINSKAMGAIPATSHITVEKTPENNDNAPELPPDLKTNQDDSNRKLNYEEASKQNDMDVNPVLEENADNTSQEDSMQKDDLDDGFNDIPPQAETSQPARNPMFEDPLKPRLSMITKDSSDAYIHDPFHQEEGSNFFTYFLIGMFACIVLYVLYHNKTKILALLLEGRRSQKGRGSRRKHTAQYRKLDTNLEEAITSTPSGRSTQIIY